MTTRLSDEERHTLLGLAREVITEAVAKKQAQNPFEIKITPALRQPGASFVTLTIEGELRGCIGSLEAHQSLVDDVREHAVQAALQDYRFPPLRTEELEAVRIEISHLTNPVPLKYEKPGDLVKGLKPGIDGVILQHGFRRATFLPQVWEQLPEPEEFLRHLCVKMGASPELWRREMLEVSIYQVEEFHE